MEFPANMMMPTAFCKHVKAEFSGIENVEIFVLDEAWAEKKGRAHLQNTFLSVTHGTNEPAKFLKIHYKGAAQKDAKPLAFVGKGITFDSGEISLKPAAVRHADVSPQRSMLNGKSVEVDNTDAEGRLVLSDAIYHASTEYKPHTLIDVATLQTGAMVIALGEVYTGVFSVRIFLSDILFFLSQFYGKNIFDTQIHFLPGPQIYSSNADLYPNEPFQTGGRPAGSATVALFLKSFAHGIEAEGGSNAATAMK
ncbi:hypothetical protein BDP27DRAFT_1509694 [Rhodocollybia butyracea]|uniref:Cytosol aminopeptidase domain-containing protein n=1 Tax=Rhodocollybia butyracea TaxID=206335 RepID=A0A9P5Q8P3_9AGAR|nr:hypothetical protein BDP27DRAFT_1509694 [Rhodocollybia butyracea]